MEIKSPLTESYNVKFEKDIDAGLIIENYKKFFNTDVTSYFKGAKKISIYKCLDSGFKFYYPFGIEGGSEFYEKLQKNSWYYMDWKWEHEIAQKYINHNDRVLEIGGGNGSFVEKLAFQGINIEGLELNRNSVEKAKEKNIKIYGETIQNFSKNKNGIYDLVCTFQVLEHITNIKEFIEASISVLKINGKFIISVPNNDSFIKFDDYGILNMPPHHQGLWNKESLVSLQNLFNLKLEKIHIEPLQKYHFYYYYQCLFGNKLTKFRIFGKLANKIIYKFIIFPFLLIFSKKIKGHTIMAVYSKNNF